VVAESKPDKRRESEQYKTWNEYNFQEQRMEPLKELIALGTKGKKKSVRDRIET
jgi:hypothetical protein